MPKPESFDFQPVLYHEIHLADPGADWVVFVHGAGGSTRTWRYQLDAFKEQFNLLMLDMRDHGQSQSIAPPVDRNYSLKLMAEDVLHVLDHLEIETAHFIGVSMGSLIVRWVEQLEPERIKKIVLGGGVFGMTWKMRFLLKSAMLFVKIIPFRLLYGIFGWIVMPKRNHRHSRKIFMREARKIPTDAFFNWLGVAKTIDGELKRFFECPISVPTLSIMGGQDHVFLPPARAYAENAEGVSLKVIPDCGHVCSIERPEQFNQLALSFLGWVKEEAAIPITG